MNGIWALEKGGCGEKPVGEKKDVHDQGGAETQEERRTGYYTALTKKKKKRENKSGKGGGTNYHQLDCGYI